MTHRILDGVESTYGWTAEGHLATIAKNGALVAQMTYDAEGRRVKKAYTTTVKTSATRVPALR